MCRHRPPAAQPVPGQPEQERPQRRAPLQAQAPALALPPCQRWRRQRQRQRRPPRRRRAGACPRLHLRTCRGRRAQQAAAAAAAAAGALIDHHHGGRGWRGGGAAAGRVPRAHSLPPLLPNQVTAALVQRCHADAQLPGGERVGGREGDRRDAAWWEWKGEEQTPPAITAPSPILAPPHPSPPHLLGDRRAAGPAHPAQTAAPRPGRRRGGPRVSGCNVSGRRALRAAAAWRLVGRRFLQAKCRVQAGGRSYQSEQSSAAQLTRFLVLQERTNALGRRCHGPRCQPLRAAAPGRCEAAVGCVWRSACCSSARSHNHRRHRRLPAGACLKVLLVQAQPPLVTSLPALFVRQSDLWRKQPIEFFIRLRRRRGRRGGPTAALPRWQLHGGRLPQQQLPGGRAQRLWLRLAGRHQRRDRARPLAWR